jgi:hypothetical protein
VRTTDQYYKTLSSFIQTLTLQQMGTHLLQGQMDVQEQVLQYQFVTTNIFLLLSIKKENSRC